MTAESQIDPAMIRSAIHQARESARQIGDLKAANARTISTLETALNQSIKGGFNVPSTTLSAVAEHRRLHRSGQPSRIASDPELQAFIRTRIDTMTFAVLITEIAAAFPKERRTSMSALSRWWASERNGESANRQIPPDPS
jgi:hypothetical protein